MDILVQNSTDVDVILQLKTGSVWKESRFPVPSDSTKRCCLKRLGSNSRIAIRDANGINIYSFIEKHQLNKGFIKLIWSPTDDTKIVASSM